MVGETGFEPATPWSRRDSWGAATGSHGVARTPKPYEKQTVVDSVPSHAFAPNAPIPTPFTTRLLPSQNPSTAGPSLLTVRAAAATLTVSTTTVYKLVAAKVLSCVRIGNAIRIDTHDLERWLGEIKTTP